MFCCVYCCQMSFPTGTIKLYSMVFTLYLTGLLEVWPVDLPHLRLRSHTFLKDQPVSQNQAFG